MRLMVASGTHLSTICSATCITVRHTDDQMLGAMCLQSHTGVYAHLVKGSHASCLCCATSRLLCKGEGCINHNVVCVERDAQPDIVIMKAISGCSASLQQRALQQRQASPPNSSGSVKHFNSLLNSMRRQA